MALATYWQKGETLDYVNTTEAVIVAGTVVDLKTRVGIAATDINPGEKGTIHMTGVFRFKKTEKAEIKYGAAVNFDKNGITTQAGTPAGYAVEDAGADAETIIVKLLG